MKKSLFAQYVDKWFGPLITKIVEKVNDTKNPLTYLHKQMLTKTFSPTLKWGSLSSNGTAITADVVAMDSSLPLKKRDAIAKAEGDIPKLGMKLYLNERTLSDLDILQAQNQDGSRTKQILQMLFADAKKCIVGIDEQLEAMFLQAFSTGVILVEDDNNTGVGIRVDFEHPDENKFGVSAKWSETTAKPLDDIEHVLENANRSGNAITTIYMDRTTFNNMRKTTQMKDLSAANFGFSSNNPPTPTMAQANEALQANYGLSIKIIDRSVTYEKNGKRTTVKPWAENVVAFVTSDQVGTLAWGRLAEMNHPVKQVNYEVADDFKLISKYHKNDPLQEFTSGQALVIPVIDEVDSIYLMDTADAATDEQTEGDANFTYEGTAYTKASVVAGLNATEQVPTSTTDQADSTLLGEINKLNDAEIAIFEDELVAAT